MSQNNFSPKIIAFLCTWCSYTAADLAGTARIKFPTEVRIIKIPCTGRVDATFVMRALSEGADGVLISGCHPGECHYQEGNYKALKRITLLKKMLKQLNINENRVKLMWASASEGEILAAEAKKFVEQIKTLGAFKTKELLQKSE